MANDGYIYPRGFGGASGSASAMPEFPRDPNAKSEPIMVTDRRGALLPVAMRRAMVNSIHIDADLLNITTDHGELGFCLDADCCSVSYFHDAVGVNKLIGSLLIDIHQGDGAELEVDGRHQECVRHYGLTVVSEHPVWGDVTTVFSFRNESNGYYGGSAMACNIKPERIAKLEVIAADWTVD